MTWWESRRRHKTAICTAVTDGKRARVSIVSLAVADGTKKALPGSARREYVGYSSWDYLNLADSRWTVGVAVKMNRYVRRYNCYQPGTDPLTRTAMVSHLRPNYVSPSHSNI